MLAAGRVGAMGMLSIPGAALMGFLPKYYSFLATSIPVSYALDGVLKVIARSRLAAATSPARMLMEPSIVMASIGEVRQSEPFGSGIGSRRGIRYEVH
jgi:hypothetical protein